MKYSLHLIINVSKLLVFVIFLDPPASPQIQNCPSEDLEFLTTDIVDWEEPTLPGGSLVSQNRFPMGEFPIGLTTVEYTFDFNGETLICRFVIVIEEDTDDGGL